MGGQWAFLVTKDYWKTGVVKKNLQGRKIDKVCGRGLFSYKFVNSEEFFPVFTDAFMMNDRLFEKLP